MDPARYQQVKAILLEALELPAPGRSAFLAAACGNDAELRAEVESLLDQEVRDDFLEPPVVPPDPTAALEADLPEDAFLLADPPDPLAGRTFSHYRVVKRLGAGGMGVVYLGEDIRLGRQAALKFLTPSLLLDEAARARFVREARAVATLDHPNICTLYGIEETPAGQLFLAMAYYEGETLKQRIARGPLSLAGSLDVARQTANGLAAAHAAGIVHRDVKPGNIMLGGGLVKILDFGIAKLTDQAGLTMLGASLGTAAYISPEQAAGGPVDHRTDIWALGVVVYEMVTGQRPFDVDSFAGLAAAVSLSPPARLRELRPDAPENLERTLQRALSTDPRDRFQSMREFVTAIDSVLQILSASTSIAIVPFTLSTSDDGSGLADAVTEAVADDLSGVGAVKVIRRSELDDPRSTVGHSNASVWSVTDDARVLLGTVAVNGSTTIVSARLFDPAQNRALAEWQIHAGSSELPRLSTDLSRAILSELGVRLSAAERRRLSVWPRVSAGSYVPYFNGRRQMSRGTAQACLAAIASFERAAAEAPQEPFAYAGIAEACVGVIEQGCAFDRDQFATRARSELTKALQIDAVEPEVEFGAAEVAYRLDGSPVRAEARLRRVLAVWPGHIRAALRLAECLMVTGTFHDAIMMAREASERHPRSPGVLRRAGRVFHFANAYGDAVRMFSAALDGEPDDVVARFDLALTLARSGDVSGARAQCDTALASDEGRALAAAAIGNAAKVHGDMAQHDAARRYLYRFQKEITGSACCFRLLDVAFGHTGRPLEYLELYDETLGLAKFMGFAPVDGSLSALVASVGLIAYLDVEPSFHAIYGAPAFTALLDQLNNTP